MKNLISFITLLVFLNTITNLMTGTQAKQSIVLLPAKDVDGDDLKVDTPYHVLSGSSLGGITEHSIPNKTCVNAVAQLTSGEGLPVIFSYAESETTDKIYSTTRLHVRFPAVIGCDRGWTVEWPFHLETSFVLAGSLPGSENDRNKWFKIVAVDLLSSDNYFVFCEQLKCQSDIYCPPVCSEVGVDENEERRLVLSESPLVVKFKKAGAGHRKN